jgi:hypothetical protein
MTYKVMQLITSKKITKCFTVHIRHVQNGIGYEVIASIAGKNDGGIRLR